MCYRNDIPGGTYLPPPQEPRPYRAAVCHADDHIEGLDLLLTFGVRVLTVMEFVLWRSSEEQASLPGLHPENGKKMTDKPTAEQFLQAFAEVSLTIIKTAAGEEILRWLTPLSALQQAILQRLGLGASLYG